MHRYTLVCSAMLLIACSGDKNAASGGTSSGGSTSTNSAGGGDQGGGSLAGAGGGGIGGSSDSGALQYTVNAQLEHDFGHQLVIPNGFGDGELTMEMWLKPDDQFPVGPTNGGQEQLTNWSNADNEPYVTGDWWYDGNFLLDGHNNGSFGEGTFSLQFYGGGRLRWLFGDGAPNVSGGHWSVGAYPADGTPSLLGAWHHVALVRRWVNQAEAQLELWIDGSMIDSEISSERTDMRQWFDNWSNFPATQQGWFWGSEKQAVVGILDQYEDYKGLIADVRYWAVAKTADALSNDWSQPITGDEPGLVGWYPMNDGAGVTTCDALSPNDCVDLMDMKLGYWSDEGPPN
jgi:hypothetical protein